MHPGRQKHTLDRIAFQQFRRRYDAVIFGVGDVGFAWARFYLEPVQDGGGGVDEAVRRQVLPEVEA